MDSCLHLGSEECSGRRRHVRSSVGMLLIGSLRSDLLQIAHIHGVQIREVITVPERTDARTHIGRERTSLVSALASCSLSRRAARLPVCLLASRLARRRRRALTCCESVDCHRQSWS